MVDKHTCVDGESVPLCCGLVLLQYVLRQSVVVFPDGWELGRENRRRFSDARERESRDAPLILLLLAGTAPSREMT
jgi:hypothetical protein